MARANDGDGEVNLQVGDSGASWFGFQAMPAKRDILFGFLKAKCKLCALDVLNLCQWPLGEQPRQQVAPGGGSAPVCNHVVVGQNSKLKTTSLSGIYPLVLHPAMCLVGLASWYHRESEYLL